MIRAILWAAEILLAVVFLVEVVWPMLRRKPLFPTYRKFFKPERKIK